MHSVLIAIVGPSILLHWAPPEAPRAPELVEVAATQEPGANVPSVQEPEITTETPSSAETVDEETAREDEKKAKERAGEWRSKNNAKVSLKARVMTGWQYENERPAEGQGSGDKGHEFFLRQARLSFGLEWKKRLSMRLSVELSDAFGLPAIPFLRNGYLNVRIADAFQVRAGYFKRPFSRLELESPGKLPFRGRGLTNSLLIEDRQYGDRAVGLMLWGKVDPARLRWYLSASNPGLSAQGIDVIGRLRIDATEWLSLGGGGGYKRTEDGSGETIDIGFAGADAELEIAGLWLMADLVAGPNYLNPERPWALGVVGFAAYSFDLPKSFQLQPVVTFEWADSDLEFAQSEAIRSIAGVNVLWKKRRLRVMPQVEFVRPLGTVTERNPWIEGETYYVMLSVEL